MHNLKEYLQDNYKRTNHLKYQKYFDEWFDGLTQDQLYWFNIQFAKNAK